MATAKKDSQTQQSNTEAPRPTLPLLNLFPFAGMFTQVLEGQVATLNSAFGFAGRLEERTVARSFDLLHAYVGLLKESASYATQLNGDFRTMVLESASRTAGNVEPAASA